MLLLSSCTRALACSQTVCCCMNMLLVRGAWGVVAYRALTSHTSGGAAATRAEPLQRAREHETVNFSILMW
jgi:hypothetical protein